MAQKQKAEYEYVESRGLYRKRVQDVDGKYVAISAKTPEKLEKKLEEFEKRKLLSTTGRKNMLVNDYIQNWLDLHSANLGFGTTLNYQSTINCNIKPYLEGKEDNPLVNSYIDEWFNLNCSNLSEASKQDYLRIINYHIKPYMLEKRIQDIYPNDIKAVVAHTTSLSASVHNKTYMLLKRMFTDAFRNGDISENPCPIMHNGGKEPSEKMALTDEQTKTLLEAIKETRAHLFCMIALYTGMRLEEILGLMWDCVYLDETPRIDVRRAVRFIGNDPVVSTTLKSKAAKRTIPIPPQLVDCLKQQKEVAKAGGHHRKGEESF